MDKRHVDRLLAVSLTALTCLFSFSHVACAALSVEPESLEIVVEPGQATGGVYSVVNQGADAARVLVQPENWPRNAVTAGGASVDDWLTVTPKEFDLAAQEKKEVKFEINPPASHEGEVSAMVFFSTTQPDGAMNITTRNGVSIYAAFADKLQPDCAISYVTAERCQQKTDGGPVDRGVIFTIGIENKGNVHLRPAGTVDIIGPEGAVCTLNIGRGFPAYVGGKEKYEVLWDNANIPPAKYEAKIHLDYGKLFNVDKKIDRDITFTVNKDKSVTSSDVAS